MRALILSLPLFKIGFVLLLLGIAILLVIDVRERGLDRRDRSLWRASRDLPNGRYVLVVVRRFGYPEPVGLVGPFADETAYRSWCADFDGYRDRLYHPHERMLFEIGVQRRVDPATPLAEARRLLETATHTVGGLADPDSERMN